MAIKIPGKQVALLDPTDASSEPPNRERSSAVVTNGAFGTLIIRKFTNNTGQAVNRLRVRVIDITTRNTRNTPLAGQPAPCGAPPCSDLRVLSSSDEPAIGTGTGTVSTNGTVLEEPPAQPNGGGYNSSLRINNITLATPLLPGASHNVVFRLGVQTRGSFRFFITVEALP